MRLLLATFFLAAISIEARDLTLSEALALAKTHSRELRIATAGLAASNLQLKAARSESWPTIAVSGSGAYLSEQSRLELNAPPIVIDQPIGSKEKFQTDARLTIPLWSGGRISSAISIAQAAAEIASLQVRSEEDRALVQARLAYFALLAADKTVAVTTAARLRNSTIQRDVESLHLAGSADSTQLLEAATAVSQAEFAEDQAESARRTAMLNLAHTLGLSPDEPLVLQTYDTAAGLFSGRPIESSIPASQRAEGAIAGANRLLQEKRLEQVKADYFPSLSAYAGYAYGKPNLNQFADTWSDYWTIGATAAWSLNLGGKTSARSGAIRFDLQAARLQSERVDEQLAHESRIARERFRLARTQLKRAREQLILATHTFRQATLQHQEGMMAANRLLQIATTVTETEALVALSEIELLTAHTLFLYAIGSPAIAEGWDTK